MEEANESGGTSRVEEEDEEGIAQDNHKGESEMMYDAIQVCFCFVLFFCLVWFGLVRLGWVFHKFSPLFFLPG